MRLIRYLPRFAKADRALAALAEHEAWSRDQIADYQLHAINALWKSAVASVPYYESLQRSRRLPSSFDDLEHFRESVPVLSKQAVRAQPELFRSRSAERGFWCRTGGATGAPMRVFWRQEAHLEMLRTKYRAYQMWGIDYLDRIAFLWGHSTFFQPGLKGKIARLRQPAEDYLRNRLRLSAYNVGPRHLSEYLQRLREFRPAAIYGYPSAVRLLAMQAKTESVQLPSVRVIAITGEPADAETIKVIEAAFGAPVMIEYGSVECGHIAHSWPDNSLRVREDVMHLETMPSDRTDYNLVVTPLNNSSFPLIRYAIEDLSTAELTIPDRGFAILRDVVGRSNDFLLTRDGDVVHSSRFDAMFKYQCKNVRRFQVHQRAEGDIEISVESEQQGGVQTEGIEQLVGEILGFRVHAQVVDQVPLTPAGKFRQITSDRARLSPERQIDSSEQRCEEGVPR